MFRDANAGREGMSYTTVRSGISAKKLLQGTAAVLLIFLCQLFYGNAFSQTVTHTAKNTTLAKVFTVIEKQTGYTFFYNKELLQHTRPVTFKVENMPLKELLTLILTDQPIDFYIEKKNIILRRKTFEKAQGPASPAVFLIEGTITDSSGVPLEGATVAVKGKNTATRTDGGGRFSMNAAAGQSLVVSFIGYQTVEHTITNAQDDVMLRLERSIQQLGTVAVNVQTGYQSITRERAPGSFAVINGEKLENKLRPDLKAAMEGQVAGMVLTKEGELEIRGVSTFQSTTSPLIVVDGYPIAGGLESINVDNIESITVLKDAVAASIYGSRSSNGVIVVTTKQGRKGVVQVSYRGSGGLTLRPDLSRLNRSSSADYVDAEMELYNQNPVFYRNNYNNNRYLSQVQYLMVAKTLNLLPAKDVDEQIARLKTNDGLGQLQEYLFRSQLTHQHNISISGGNDKSLMHAAVKYIANRGNMLYTGDERMIVDIRNDWKPSRIISVRLLSNLNYSTSQNPVRSPASMIAYNNNSAYGLLHPYDLVVDPATGQRQDIFVATPKKIALYQRDGMKLINYNPLDDLGKEMEKAQNMQFRIGGTITAALARGINIEAGGTWSRGNALNRQVYDKDSYRMRLGYNDGFSKTDPTLRYIPYGDALVESRTLYTSYILRAQLNFNRTYEKHSIIAIAGSEIIRNTTDNNVSPTRFGYDEQSGTFASFNYKDYNAGLNNADMFGTSRPVTASIGGISFDDSRFASWYSNASYQYNDRYLLSGSIRLDQTNFFGTNPKYRYRPLWSAGATYKLSNEEFFDVRWISKLYLRGSYGINGFITLNSGPFLIIEPQGNRVSPVTGDISYGISSPPNNSLRWERTATTNIGADISLLESRLGITLDYYLRKSKDLLSPNNVDPTTGYTELMANVGAIDNTGLEVTIEGDVMKKERFRWNIMGTLSHNRNKVKQYHTNFLYPTDLAAPKVINREGYPGQAVFSYRYAGLDNNGNALYYNANGEKVSGGNLRLADPVYSGTLRPTFVYSLTNSFAYRNFQLSFMLIAKTGNVMRKDAFTTGNYQNKNVANRWRNPGDEKTAIYPKLAATSLDAYYFPFTDILIERADYLKLREAVLSYTFNKNRLKKLGINDLKLTAQGRNLFLWTANSNKQDPETSVYNTNNAIGGTQEQGFSTLPLRPEFYLGLAVIF